MAHARCQFAHSSTPAALRPKSVWRRYMLCMKWLVLRIINQTLHVIV
jgi:hypothetical protein